jgi:alkylation response protein AidB-like acyl-CoA dehydrogenase
MTDSEQRAPDPAELEMVRGTTRQLFADGPTLSDLGNLGLLGLLTPEDRGGSGWRPVEASIVAEECGRALARVPWAQNLLAAAALSCDDRWSESLALLLDGTRCGALTREDGLVFSPDGVTVTGQVTVTGEDRPHVLVLLGGKDRVFAVDGEAPRTDFAQTTSLDTTRGESLLSLDGVAMRVVLGTNPDLLRTVGILLACADSLGALSASAALVRKHLSERTAFQQPIAGFQVIQHRLANMEVLEATCAGLVRTAARALASPEPRSTAAPLVAAMHGYFARHVGRALDDCIQLSGGIGFTWEYPAHHASRRDLLNMSWVRTVRQSLENLDLLAAYPSVYGTPEFRAHARVVIAHKMPFPSREGHRAPTTPDEEQALHRWYRTLYEHDLLGGSWPEEWGGNPHHLPLHDLIVNEELIRARAPRPIDQVQLASHVLLRFGTPDQKAHYLPRIRSGADIWCQLFSEPDCGSDLAGIRARADRCADGTWALSGQKTWTTDGHWAQMGLALLRTSSEARRHDGLTAFLVPMDAANLEIRPKLTMGGAFEFNDVFLDGVDLPECQVIGEVGQGWSVAMSGLEVERFGVGGNVLLLHLLLVDLVDVSSAVVLGGTRAIDHADVRHRLAGLAAEVQAAQVFVADYVSRTLLGDEQPADAAIAKILHSEAYYEVARLAVEFISDNGPVPDAVAAQAVRLEEAWLWSKALTISGGSSEVMRNIIARRRLGLPQVR